jgi:hypothetical protein
MTELTQVTEPVDKGSSVTTVSSVTTERAVNLLVAAFPGAVVDRQPAAEVDSNQWRRGDNGQLAHRCQVCKSVLTCRRHGGRWTCSFCRPEEEAP